jgi:Flp pilus assembly protein TadB
LHGIGDEPRRRLEEVPMTPESRLVQIPEASMPAVPRAGISESWSFLLALLAVAGLAFLGVPLAAFVLLGAALFAPVLVVLAAIGLARLDRSRAASARSTRSP